MKLRLKFRFKLNLNKIIRECYYYCV